MTLEKLKEIAQKYLQGVATKEEEALLHAHYEKVDDDAAETIFTVQDTSIEQLGQEMLSAIKERMAEQDPVLLPSVTRHRIWPRVAVAASILLLIGLGIYFISFNQSEKLPLEANNTAKLANDLLPGIDGAVLTLADGRKVILDKIENGIVTGQQEAGAVKQGNLISYENAPVSTANNITYNTLTTPKGRQFQLVLSDGSRVWLNAASSITYPTQFTGAERKVEITGEAYFEVEHDATKPFVVSKGETAVQVLGTHFNVNTYQDESEIRVTLLEGSVKVSNNAASLLIKPGEQARVTGAGKMSSEKNVNTEEVMAWKNGLFSFNEANITAIMRQVARWYDAEVVYEGDVKQEYFSGTVPRSANASVLLKVLESTNTIKFEINNGKIIVQPVK